MGVFPFPELWLLEGSSASQEKWPFRGGGTPNAGLLATSFPHLPPVFPTLASPKAPPVCSALPPLKPRVSSCKRKSCALGFFFKNCVVNSDSPEVSHPAAFQCWMLLGPLVSALVLLSVECSLGPGPRFVLGITCPEPRDPSTLSLPPRELGRPLSRPPFLPVPRYFLDISRS